MAGFAYLNESTRTGAFYPIIPPYKDNDDDDAMEDSELYSLAADGDANYEPKQFAVPLYIPEFDEHLLDSETKDVDSKKDTSGKVMQRGSHNPSPASLLTHTL